jgi:hypothetical protein
MSGINLDDDGKCHFKKDDKIYHKSRNHIRFYVDILARIS